MSADTQRLREIQERAEKATPGPWYYVNRDDDYAMNQDVVATVPDLYNHQGYEHSGFCGAGQAEPEIIAGLLVQRPLAIGTPDAKWEENAEFIAHAREDVPWLLEQIATLKSGVAAVCSDWVDLYDAQAAIEALGRGNGEESDMAAHTVDVAQFVIEVRSVLAGEPDTPQPAALTREKAESVVTEAMVKAGTQAALAVDVGPGSPDACCSILDYPHPIPATCYLYAHQMEKVVRAALEAALSAGQAESK